jgi:hypothetical protein
MGFSRDLSLGTIIWIYYFNIIVICLILYVYHLVIFFNEFSYDGMYQFFIFKIKMVDPNHSRYFFIWKSFWTSQINHLCFENKKLIHNIKTIHTIHSTIAQLFFNYLYNRRLFALYLFLYKTSVLLFICFSLRHLCLNQYFLNYNIFQHCLFQIPFIPLPTQTIL